MDDEIRTDEQFWEDFRETIKEARQLPEWKRRYRVMIYGEEGRRGRGRGSGGKERVVIGK